MQVTAHAEPVSEPRIPLSRERVLRAAVKVADEVGIESLTMRRLAEEVGTEAMSLYYHVASKEDILAGIADVIAAEINEAVDGLDVPSSGAAWKVAMRQRILSARQVMLRHPWAPGVLERRAATSPGVLRYFDGVVGIMRDGGFSFDLAHHSLHALGSRALGFAQEPFDPGNQAGASETAAPPAEMAALYPNLAGMLMEIVHDDPDSTLGWCDDQTEFEFGLDVILDGLDRMRDASEPR
jgi:AcrR family transcriptional regulator